MTGLDRLRKLTDATLGYVRVASVTPHDYEYENDVEWDERMHLSELLASIYSQINREQDAEVADSPYDAILPEDRGAAAWVRDHGGLDAVRSEWSSRVPYDKHEQRSQRLLGHIAECEAALRRRNQRIEELGHRVGDLATENAELRRRAMPDGMEWPRYESGEPVRIGHDGVRVVELFEDEYRLWGEGEPVSEEPIATGLYGQRVKRPAVLAADGEPLEVGQTVWLADGSEWLVEELVEYGALCFDGDRRRTLDPSQLTHTKPEPPDSWERIEEDALSFVEDNTGIPHDQDQMERDMLAILRRCKALAKRGE